MANLSSLFGNNAFKPSEVEEVNIDFSPLPPGNYKVSISESELAQTKSGNGTMLTLKIVVADGDFAKRVLFENLCIQHSSEKAQAIAQSRLKQICDALGIKALKDTTQLHDKPFMVSIGIERDNYQSDKQGTEVNRNTIKSYASLGSSKTSAVAVEEGIELEDIPF